MMSKSKSKPKTNQVYRLEISLVSRHKTKVKIKSACHVRIKFPLTLKLNHCKIDVSRLQLENAAGFYIRFQRWHGSYLAAPQGKHVWPSLAFARRPTCASNAANLATRDYSWYETQSLALVTQTNNFCWVSPFVSQFSTVCILTKPSQAEVSPVVNQILKRLGCCRFDCRIRNSKFESVFKTSAKFWLYSVPPSVAQLWSHQVIQVLWLWATSIEQMLTLW